MNYFVKNDKSLCCGCTACVNICPNKNIIMQTDSDGFVYPSKIKECTSCNLCVKVCPITNAENLKNPSAENCFAITAPDKDLLKKSTSGGAFTLLLNSYLKNESEFVVFGAEMCADLKVRHTYATTLEDCAKFRKSKYLKSEIGDCYIKTKQFLKEGKKVVFSGTPCQIAGLKAFLLKDYENLFTIDLVCHGVPSQMHFDKYKELLEKKYKDKLISYQFRSKKKYGFNGEHSSSVKAQFENKVYEVYADYDYYMKAFYAKIMFMESCYMCRFKNKERVSDITIADFWGIENLSNKFNNSKRNKAASLVIPNSRLAKAVFKQCEGANKFETNIGNAIKGNSNLVKSFDPNKNRDEFLKAVCDKDFKFAVDTYLGKPKVFSVKRILRAVTPRFVIKLAKKIIK